MNIKISDRKSFIVGIAEGKTLQIARANARANIAQFFGSNISVLEVLDVGRAGISQHNTTRVSSEIHSDGMELLCHFNDDLNYQIQRGVNRKFAISLIDLRAKKRMQIVHTWIKNEKILDTVEGDQEGRREI